MSRSTFPQQWVTIHMAISLDIVFKFFKHETGSVSMTGVRGNVCSQLSSWEGANPVIKTGSFQWVGTSSPFWWHQRSTFFWDITSCSPLSVNRRFGGTYRLRLQGHLRSRWFLVALIFLPWRWKRYVPPKRRVTTNYTALYPWRWYSS
jgi:hypothetical protein